MSDPFTLHNFGQQWKYGNSVYARAQQQQWENENETMTMPFDVDDEDDEADDDDDDDERVGLHATAAAAVEVVDAVVVEHIMSNGLLRQGSGWQYCCQRFVLLMRG